jgi:hypothetical protein
MKPQDERNHVQGLMSKAALEKQLRQLKKVSEQPAVKERAPAPGLRFTVLHCCCVLMTTFFVVSVLGGGSRNGVCWAGLPQLDNLGCWHRLCFLHFFIKRPCALRNLRAHGSEVVN